MTEALYSRADLLRHHDKLVATTAAHARRLAMQDEDLPSATSRIVAGRPRGGGGFAEFGGAGGFLVPFWCSDHWLGAGIDPRFRSAVPRY
jgi:hypothetical protein